MGKQKEMRYQLYIFTIPKITCCLFLFGGTAQMVSKGFLYISFNGYINKRSEILFLKDAYTMHSGAK